MKVDVNPSHRLWSGVCKIYNWVFPRHCIVCSCECTCFLCDLCKIALPYLEHACPQCAMPTPPQAEENILCGKCVSHHQLLDRVFCAYLYKWPIDFCIKQFKFHQNNLCGRMLVSYVAQLSLQWHRPQALVPIPLHGKRLRERGFDQALIIARGLARCHQLPCLDHLRRMRFGPPQSRLHACERNKNMQHAFVATRALPKHVALVDDVMTTGATLRSAAHCLRQAGVDRIDAWVCARTVS